MSGYFADVNVLAVLGKFHTNWAQKFDRQTDAVNITGIGCIARNGGHLTRGSSDAPNGLKSTQSDW